MEKRTCTKCKETKDVTEFYHKDSGSPFPSQRYQSRCKFCHNKKNTNLQAKNRWMNSQWNPDESKWLRI